MSAALPAPPGAAALPTTPAPVSSLFSGSLPPDADSISDFDKFIAALPDADVPSADRSRAMEQEFMSDPELKKEWDGFVENRRGPGTHETMKAFAQRLSRNRQLRRLVAKFSRSQGFGGGGAGRPFAPGQSGGPVAAASRPGSHPSVDFGGPSAQGGGKGVGRFDPRRPAAPVSGFGPLGIVGREVAAGGGGLQGEARTAASSGDPSADERATTQMKTTPLSAGADVDLKNFASFCYKAGASRQQFCDDVHKKGKLGDNTLFTACNKSNHMQECLSLCLNNPGAGCQTQARNVQSCMDGGGTAGSCASNCDTRGDCLPRGGGVAGADLVVGGGDTLSPTPTPTNTPFSPNVGDTPTDMPTDTPTGTQPDAAATADTNTAQPTPTPTNTETDPCASKAPPGGYCFLFRGSFGKHCCCYDSQGRSGNLGCPL